MRVQEPIVQGHVFIDDAPEVLSSIDVVSAHRDPQRPRLGIVVVRGDQRLQNRFGR